MLCAYNEFGQQLTLRCSLNNLTLAANYLFPSWSLISWAVSHAWSLVCWGGWVVSSAPKVHFIRVSCKMMPPVKSPWNAVTIISCSLFHLLRLFFCSLSKPCKRANLSEDTNHPIWRTFGPLEILRDLFQCHKTPKLFLNLHESAQNSLFKKEDESPQTFVKLLLNLDSFLCRLHKRTLCQLYLSPSFENRSKLLLSFDLTP